MRRRACLTHTLILLVAFASSSAEARAAPKPQPSSTNNRAVAEIAGKFKWGMTPEECLKVIAESIQARYNDLAKHEISIYRQDQLRQEAHEDIQKVRESVVKFDPGDANMKQWVTSIIQNEFATHNDESMLVIWERDQRRFLFFWHERLYKQFIAFNSEHPVFAGKSFDDFAKIVQNRYGPAEMKFSQLKTRNDSRLDHLEWAPVGEYQLFATDQSEFYGNFCLVLFNPATVKQLERSRSMNSPKPGRNSAIIDNVTAPAKHNSDSNEDIVDRLTGKRKNY